MANGQRQGVYIPLPDGSQVFVPNEPTWDEIVGIIREVGTAYPEVGAEIFPLLRTAPGQAKEFVKGIVQGGIGTVLTGAQGIAGLLTPGIDTGVERGLESLQRGVQGWTPAEYQEAWGHKLGAGLGSTAPFFAGAGAGVALKLGKLGQTLIPAAMGATVGAGEQTQRIKDVERRTGQDVGFLPELGATALGFGIGTLEAAAPTAAAAKVGGLAKMAGARVFEHFKGKPFADISTFAKLMARTPKTSGAVRDSFNAFKSIVGTATAEGAQEVTSSLLQDFTQKGIYDRTLKPGQSMLDEFLIGGFAGGVMDALLIAASRGYGRGWMGGAYEEARLSRENEIYLQKAWLDALGARSETLRTYVNRVREVQTDLENREWEEGADPERVVRYPLQDALQYLSAGQFSVMPTPGGDGLTILDIDAESKIAEAVKNGATQAEAINQVKVKNIPENLTLDQATEYLRELEQDRQVLMELGVNLIGLQMNGQRFSPEMTELAWRINNLEMNGVPAKVVAQFTEKMRSPSKVNPGLVIRRFNAIRDARIEMAEISPRMREIQATLNSPAFKRRRSKAHKEQKAALEAELADLQSQAEEINSKIPELPGEESVWETFARENNLDPENPNLLLSRGEVYRLLKGTQGQSMADMLFLHLARAEAAGARNSARNRAHQLKLPYNESEWTKQFLEEVTGKARSIGKKKGDTRYSAVGEGPTGEIDPRALKHWLERIVAEKNLDILNGPFSAQDKGWSYFLERVAGVKQWNQASNAQKVLILARLSALPTMPEPTAFPDLSRKSFRIPEFYAAIRALADNKGRGNAEFIAGAVGVTEEVAQDIARIIERSGRGNLKNKTTTFDLTGVKPESVFQAEKAAKGKQAYAKLLGTDTEKGLMDAMAEKLTPSEKALVRNFLIAQFAAADERTGATEAEVGSPEERADGVIHSKEVVDDIMKRATDALRRLGISDAIGILPAEETAPAWQMLHARLKDGESVPDGFFTPLLNKIGLNLAAVDPAAELSGDALWNAVSPVLFEEIGHAFDANLYYTQPALEALNRFVKRQVIPEGTDAEANANEWTWYDRAKNKRPDLTKEVDIMKEARAHLFRDYMLDRIPSRNRAGAVNSVLGRAKKVLKSLVSDVDDTGYREVMRVLYDARSGRIGRMGPGMTHLNREGPVRNLSPLDRVYTEETAATALEEAKQGLDRLFRVPGTARVPEGTVAEDVNAPIEYRRVNIPDTYTYVEQDEAGNIIPGGRVDVVEEPSPLVAEATDDLRSVRYPSSVDVAQRELFHPGVKQRTPEGVPDAFVGEGVLDRETTYRNVVHKTAAQLGSRQVRALMARDFTLRGVPKEVILSLRRRGLIDDKGELTDMGRAVRGLQGYGTDGHSLIPENERTEIERTYEEETTPDAVGMVPRVGRNASNLSIRTLLKAAEFGLVEDESLDPALRAVYSKQAPLSNKLKKHVQRVIGYNLGEDNRTWGERVLDFFDHPDKWDLVMEAFGPLRREARIFALDRRHGDELVSQSIAKEFGKQESDVSLIGAARFMDNILHFMQQAYQLGPVRYAEMFEWDTDGMLIPGTIQRATSPYKGGYIAEGDAVGEVSGKPLTTAAVIDGMHVNGESRETPYDLFLLMHRGKYLHQKLARLKAMKDSYLYGGGERNAMQAIEEEYDRIKELIKAKHRPGGISTEAEYDQIIADVVEDFPEVVQWAQHYKEWNKANLQFAVDTGYLSQELADEWADSYYVPEFRKELLKYTGKRKKRGGVERHRAYVEKELKGSSAVIDVPLVERIMYNQQRMIQDGMINVRNARAARDLVALGMAEYSEKDPGPRSIKYFENGVKKYVRFKSNYDEVLGQAMHLGATDLIGGGLENFARLSRVLWAPTRVMRELITRTPNFIARQLLRDPVAAGVTSGIDRGTISLTAQTIKNMNFKVLEVMEYMGNALDRDYVMNPGEYRRVVNKTLKRVKDAQEGNNMNLMAVARKAWDFMGKASKASDAAVRHAVFKDTLEATGNPFEASFQAMEILNFGRRGQNPLLSALLSTVPFMNARIQGIDVFYRAGTGQYTANPDLDTAGEIMAKFYARGLMMAALTFLYWSHWKDDEDYQNLRDQAAEDNIYLHIGKNINISWPVPFEVGYAFKTVPEVLLNGYYKHQQGVPRQAQATANALFRGAKKQAQLDLVPQIFRPVADVMMNLNNFTRNPIVSEFERGSRQDREIGGPETNYVARGLSRFLPGFDPVETEYLLRNYFPGWGAYALMAADNIARKAVGDSSVGTPQDILDFTRMPVTSIFVHKGRGGLQEDFYNLREEVNKLMGSLGELRKNQDYDEFLARSERYEDLLYLQGAVNSMDRFMEKWRERRDRLLRDKTIDSDKKKELLQELEEQRDFRLAPLPILMQRAGA